MYYYSNSEKGQEMNKQDRSKYIGGHDIADLIDVGFNGPWHVWRMKTDPEYRTQYEERGKDVVLFECGKALESVAQKKCLELLPSFTFKKARFIKDKKLSFIGGTPDGYFISASGEKYIAEFKATNDQHEWGEEATDQVPKKVFIQCQWYMMLSGATKTIVGVLFWNSSFKMYVVERDDGIIEQLRKVAENFWFDNVQKKIEPTIDHSSACRSWLTKCFVGHAKKEINAPVEIVGWGITAAGLAKKKQETEKEYKKLINDMLALMQDASKMKCPEWSLSVSEKGRVTFKAKGVEE